MQDFEMPNWLKLLYAMIIVILLAIAVARGAI